jgi:GT2 family glycosyltransferase
MREAGPARKNALQPQNCPFKLTNVPSRVKSFVIIPVHNRKTVTLECLRHLFAENNILPAGCEVVVVDDGSCDGTGEAVREAFPQVHLLSGNGNLYWTGGIARGMKFAIESGASYLFWLNDDCLPRPTALGAMLAYLQAHPRSVVSAACFGPENRTQPRATGFVGRTLRAAVEDSAVKVEGVCGYCVALPAQLCAEIGLPDAWRMPHYAADNIYTLKAHRHGYEVVLLGSAKADLRDHLTNIQSPRDLVRSHGREERFDTLFLQRKSRFYLPGQYYYHTAKYGLTLGFCLFAWKCLRWLSGFAGAKIVSLLRSSPYAAVPSSASILPPDSPC